MKTLLSIAIHKVEWLEWCKQYYAGNVTPCEFMALVKAGAKDHYYTSSAHIAYIKAKIKTGEGGAHTIYFNPTGELKEMLKGRFNLDTRGHE